MLNHILLVSQLRLRVHSLYHSLATFRKIYSFIEQADFLSFQTFPTFLKQNKPVIAIR